MLLADPLIEVSSSKGSLVEVKYGFRRTEQEVWVSGYPLSLPCDLYLMAIVHDIMVIYAFA